MRWESLTRLSGPESPPSDDPWFTVRSPSTWRSGSGRPGTSSVPLMTSSAMAILSSTAAWPGMTMRWAWGSRRRCMASTMVVTRVMFSM